MAVTFKLQGYERHRLTTDGKGVTTLVALLGCPLRCRYCINKDMLSTGRYREYTPQRLLDELMIDFCYFVATGGGVTFGGGESLMQSEAILEFKKIIPEYVAINVETSMNIDISEDAFVVLMEKIDHFIIDIKTLDPDIYMAYTATHNKNVIKNLDRICKLNYQDKCRIRIPVIPEYKSAETAKAEAEKIRAMGFNNVEVFPYILRDNILHT